MSPPNLIKVVGGEGGGFGVIFRQKGLASGKTGAITLSSLIYILIIFTF